MAGPALPNLGPRRPVPADNMLSPLSEIIWLVLDETLIEAKGFAETRFRGRRTPAFPQARPAFRGGLRS